MSAQQDTDDREERSADTVRFSLHDEHTLLDGLPHDPVRSMDYANPVANGQGPNIPYIRGFLYWEEVRAYDAMRAGWMMFSPFTFDVVEDQHGDIPYRVIADNRFKDAGLIELTMVGGNPVVELTTLWDIELPDSMFVLSHEPEISPLPNLTVLPSPIESTGEKVPITIRFTVTGETRITKNQAIAQLFPMDTDSLSASQREATEAEISTFKNEMRHRSISPTKYVDERRNPLPGDLELVDKNHPE